MQKTTIAVAGLGYVGLSNAILLARKHAVRALDIDPARVTAVNAGTCPVRDAGMEDHLRRGGLDLRATTDPDAAFAGADFILVATPTDYDPATNVFDTGSVEQVVHAALAANPDATIVIKSTVPVGYCARLRAETGSDRILFSPEFLREGQALHDNLHPSRIVVGPPCDRARQFADLLRDCALETEVPVLLTGSTEAEAIKLFSNTYLAMRVAYFNELDSYALAHGLDTGQIVEGVGLDPRIGTHYNNPSFGYGGYCLPKDSKQLLANYADVPQTLIRSIVDANRVRKDFIAARILEARPACVGIYRLAMKSGSDNFRQSAILGIMRRLARAGVALIVHEPGLSGPAYMDAELVDDLGAFKARADLIVANRRADELADVADKLFTRDLFGAD